MVLHLADSLLALAASIEGDGGHAVCRTLASVLRDTAPFDAGEVVLRQERGFHRFPFGGDERPVAGDDLVNQVLANHAPLRLDDQKDLEAFPETRERMAQIGLKSALILPLGTVLPVQAPAHGASPTGILALARRHGWAFVGASLNFLGPLAAMAGLALDRSLALTALGHPAGPDQGANRERRDTLRREGATLIAELQTLRAASAAGGDEVATLRASLAAARDELADARGAGIAAQSALDQALSRCRDLQARLDRAPSPAPRVEADAEPATEAAAVAATEDEGPPGSLATPGAPDAIPPSPGAAGGSARRSRRRRRGAFEPPGGP